MASCAHGNGVLRAFHYHWSGEEGPIAIGTARARCLRYWHLIIDVIEKKIKPIPLRVEMPVVSP
jgi:hypothetical protein